MDLVWTRVTRKFVRIPVVATLATGGSATIAGVDIALLPQRSAPDESTQWTAAIYDSGVATVLIAGPDADPSGALVLPEGGADVWARITDVPEVDAANVGRIDLER